MSEIYQPIREMLLPYKNLNIPKNSPSLLLGICEDGLPFFVELDHMGLRSTIIIGDDNYEIIPLLKTLIYSAPQLTDPNQIQFAIITNSAHFREFSDLFSTMREYFLGIINWNDEATNDLIRSLHQVAAKRFNGRNNRVATVLIIDEFFNINYLNEEILRNLKWLMSNGPRAGIWPIVSLQMKTVKNLEIQEWLPLLPLQIFGSTDGYDSYPHLKKPDNHYLQNLKPGKDYLVRSGNSWLKFSIPYSKMENLSPLVTPSTEIHPMFSQIHVSTEFP